MSRGTDSTVQAHPYELGHDKGYKAGYRDGYRAREQEEKQRQHEQRLHDMRVEMTQAQERLRRNGRRENWFVGAVWTFYLSIPLIAFWPDGVWPA